MGILLYLDLQQENIASVKDKFNMTKYVVSETILDPKQVVIISDDKNASQKWHDYAIIGIEHKGAISGVEYVTDSLENVDEKFVELVYCRKFGLPVIIKETPRLIIREMCLEDVADICRLYEDDVNVRFVPKVKSYEEEMELARAYIKNMYGIYGYGLWVVVHKQSGCVIGRTGIEHREVDGEIYREIGYLIEREYQNQGLGIEAASVVLEFAKDYGMDDLVAYINNKNTPSLKLAKRLGGQIVKQINDGVEEFVLFRF